MRFTTMRCAARWLISVLTRHPRQRQNALMNNFPSICARRLWLKHAAKSSPLVMKGSRWRPSSNAASSEKNSPSKKPTQPPPGNHPAKMKIDPLVMLATQEACTFIYLTNHWQWLGADCPHSHLSH